MKIADEVKAKVKSVDVIVAAARALLNDPETVNKVNEEVIKEITFENSVDAFHTLYQAFERFKAAAVEAQVAELLGDLEQAIKAGAFQQSAGNA